MQNGLSFVGGTTSTANTFLQERQKLLYLIRNYYDTDENSVYLLGYAPNPERQGVTDQTELSTLQSFSEMRDNYLSKRSEVIAKYIIDQLVTLTNNATTADIKVELYAMKPAVVSFRDRKTLTGGWNWDNLVNSELHDLNTGINHPSEKPLTFVDRDFFGQITYFKSKVLSGGLLPSFLNVGFGSLAGDIWYTMPYSLLARYGLKFTMTVGKVSRNFYIFASHNNNRFDFWQNNAVILLSLRVALSTIFAAIQNRPDLPDKITVNKIRFNALQFSSINDIDKLSPDLTKAMDWTWGVIPHTDVYNAFQGQYRISYEYPNETWGVFSPIDLATRIARSTTSNTNDMFQVLDNTSKAILGLARTGDKATPSLNKLLLHLDTDKRNNSKSADLLGSS